MINQVVKPHLPSLKLWRLILRKIKQLPYDSQTYYRNYAIEHFWSFRDVKDPKRVDEIVTKSRENVKWICKKYNVPMDE